MENSEDALNRKINTEDLDHSIPENAFLVIRGTKSVPLNQGIIKIGRHHDNTIVIDDPRISRHHVELRAIKGHFDIFDLTPLVEHTSMAGGPPRPYFIMVIAFRWLEWKFFSRRMRCFQAAACAIHPC